MSDNDGATDSGAFSRREALKKAALAAGVAVWTTPVIAGVFSAPASAQTGVCSPEGDSDVVIGTITGGYDANTNCAGLLGRYNGQDATFTLLGGDGTVQVGGPGTDNRIVQCSYYTIVNPTGFACIATWSVLGCLTATALSTNCVSPGQGGWVAGAFPLPYCTTGCASNRLVLNNVFCCPT